MKKNILITNDDGFDSVGLKALCEALRDIANIYVVAPSSEKSACGHSLTITKPLKFIEIKKDFYKLDDGTPSDCVYLALCEIFKDKKPDLVISGINIGSNMGEDITYSGTASAAMEAVLQGIPAIAISQVMNFHGKNYGYALAQKIIKDIVIKIFNNKFPLDEKKFLNINIPPIDEANLKGIKITHAGKRIYTNEAQKNVNPKGISYYWIGNRALKWVAQENSDLEAIKNGYVSISPIHLDMTSYNDIDNLKNWIL